MTVEGGFCGARMLLPAVDTAIAGLEVATVELNRYGVVVFVGLRMVSVKVGALVAVAFVGIASGVFSRLTVATVVVVVVIQFEARPVDFPPQLATNVPECSQASVPPQTDLP